MSAPPPPGLRHSEPAKDERRGPDGTEQLICAAHDILNGCGYEMSRSKLSRLVRRFETRVAHNGWEFFDFLANAVLMDADTRRRALLDPDIARAVSYADTTGERAVANVIRGRGF